MPDAPAIPFELVSDNDRLMLELKKMRDELVMEAEEVSMVLEDRMRPGVAAALRGDDQAKARRLFVTQAERLKRELHKLKKLAEEFRVHIH